jgi:hypothetical protein
MDQKVPFSFGQHPKFEKSYKRYMSERIKELKAGIYVDKDRIPLTSFAKSGHVYLIPRDKYVEIVDDEGDLTACGDQKAIIPFSSWDLYADIDEDDYFSELRHPAFLRLTQISQLGYLVPPRPEDWDPKMTVSYLVPAFPHNRYMHSRTTGFLMEAILAKYGLTERERFPIVLTAFFHDSPMPAGGDSIKRVAPKELDEERNLGYLLRYYGLLAKWKKKYGFNIKQAERWIGSEDVKGHLLDCVDKFAYVSLDCYHIGYDRPCKTRSFGIKNPLVMDVWQDIKINQDFSDCAFIDPDRLFKFLFFRALEHQDLLMNPYSRALDFFLQKVVQPLYEKGIITKEQLLTHSDLWLHDVLRKAYPEKHVWAIIEPEILTWKKFDTKEEFDDFCSKNPDTDHTEYIKGFNLGLDFKVWDGAKAVPAREVFSKEQVGSLEEINKDVKGYYAYYAKPEGVFGEKNWIQT